MTCARFESIWYALEDTRTDAASMKIKSELLVRIQESVRSWGLAEPEAAHRLGLTIPCFDDLLRGRIDKFSLDALLNLATASGLSLSLHVAPQEHAVA